MKNIKSSKLVYGVGINDADYVQVKKTVIGKNTQGKNIIQVWVCPFYRAWTAILQRCYSTNWKTKYPTYENAIVCDEWHTFTNFKRWMETQSWLGNQLDKDLLVKGNKVYGPETCAFVPQRINKLLLTHNAARGQYPLGVNFEKSFIAKVKDGKGVRLYLGSFTTAQEAHKAWQLAKAKVIESVILSWIGEESYREDVADSLLTRAVRLRSDSLIGAETISI